MYLVKNVLENRIRAVPLLNKVIVGISSGIVSLVSRYL